MNIKTRYSPHVEAVSLLHPGDRQCTIYDANDRSKVLCASMRIDVHRVASCDEIYELLPEAEKYRVFNVADGVIIRAYYSDKIKQWNIATNKTICANWRHAKYNSSKTFGEMFYEALMSPSCEHKIDWEKLDKNYTHVYHMRHISYFNVYPIEYNYVTHLYSIKNNDMKSIKLGEQSMRHVLTDRKEAAEYMKRCMENSGTRPPAVGVYIDGYGEIIIKSDAYIKAEKLNLRSYHPTLYNNYYPFYHVLYSLLVNDAAHDSIASCCRNYERSMERVSDIIEGTLDMVTQRYKKRQCDPHFMEKADKALKGIKNISTCDMINAYKKIMEFDTNDRKPSLFMELMPELSYYHR